MAFKSFNEKLRAQIHRREAAKLRVHTEYNLLTTTISDTVAQTKQDVVNRFDNARTMVTDKIQAAEDAVTGRIHKAQEAVTGRLGDLRGSITQRFDNTKRSLQESYDSVKQAVNPEPKIRENPWAWLTGALVAGLFAGPSLRTHFRGEGERRSRNLGPSSRTARAAYGAPEGSPDPRAQFSGGSSSFSSEAPQTSSYSEEAPKARSQGSMRQAMLEPIIASVAPYVSEMGRRFMQNALDRMFPNQAGPVSETQQTQTPGVQEKFPKSMSRRMAPPPPPY